MGWLERFQPLSSFLRDDAIVVPEEVEAVWLRKVRTEYYSTNIPFDGEHFTEIPVRLDAKILSDDYVNHVMAASSPARSWDLPASICPATTRRPNSTFDYRGFPTTSRQCRLAIRRIRPPPAYTTELNAAAMRNGRAWFAIAETV